MATATKSKKEKTSSGLEEGDIAMVGVASEEESQGEETAVESETEAVPETPPEITGDELAAKIQAEKIRLEDLLCGESEALTEATVEFNNANEEMKCRKKHLEAQQLKINEIVGKLAEVLNGRWRPDPQKELPFPEGSAGIGEQMDLKLWRSEPVTTLGLSDSLNAKLDQEGFPTLGTISDEIEVYDPPFGSTEMGPGQVKKIVAAFREFQLKLESEKPDTPLPGPDSKTMLDDEHTEELEDSDLEDDEDE